MTLTRRTKRSKAQKTIRTARKALKAWGVYRFMLLLSPWRLAFALGAVALSALAAIFAKRKSNSTTGVSGAVPSPVPPPADADQAEHRYVQTQQTGV